MPGATPLTRSPAAATPAPAAKPTPARAAPATATAAATPTRAQGGPPAVRINATSKSAAEAAPGVLELKGMSDFKPPAPLADFLDAHKTSIVNVQFGGLAQGLLEVKTVAKGKYRIKKQPLPLAHPAFGLVAEFAPGLMPALIVGVNDSKVIGEVGLAAGAQIESIAYRIQKAPDMLGLAGFKITAMPAITNTIEGGSLHLGLKGVEIKLGAAFIGKFNFDVLDTTVAFDSTAKVAVKGLAGDLILKRATSGLVTGKVAVASTLGKGLSGSVDVAWDGVSVTGIGKLAYKGEKFSGEVTMFLMERKQAEQLAKAKQPPSAAPAPAPSKQAPAHIDYVVFGEGNLGFSFTPWLTGTAQAIIDPKGNLTVIGELKPQKEFNLFNPPQKEYVKELFKFEIHASYGLPPIADVFIFASVGMDVFAKLGPARLYDIIIKGTYSTDPTVAKNFSIGGTFNLSAAAGVRLRLEAGAGLEILGHDIKAGAGITGIAGIKAYAMANPVVGYREKAAEGQDLKGEWFISGTLEMAAQPFLGLGGDLFVELETPWWSPLSDNKWTWPLFSKEWPLGGSMGMLVSVEHVFGSGEFPKFDLQPIKEFKAENCLTELYKDNAKSGPGKEVEQKGQWGERNTPSANPPPKTPQPGNLKPGKPAALAKAKPKQVAKTKGKPATPDAKTKGGKSVDQLQTEAQKKGKGPKGKEGKTDTGALKKTSTQDRTDAQKMADLQKAVAEAKAEMVKKSASVKTVKARLAAIQAKYRLTSLVLVKDKEDRYHVKAIINPTLEGPTGILFTAEELVELDKVAKEYAAQINKKEKQKAGFKAAAMADLEKFIKDGGNVQTGKMVESMAAPAVEELAREINLTVIKGASMRWVDASGKVIGGAGPELDFLIVGSRGVYEVLSAKFKTGRVDVGNDVAHLTAFQTLPTDGPDLLAVLLSGQYGKNKEFPNVASVNVASNLGVMSLAAFRAKYLSQILVRQIVITPLQPGPEHAGGIQLRVTRDELVQKTAELMKKYL